MLVDEVRFFSILTDYPKYFLKKRIFFLRF